MPSASPADLIGLQRAVTQTLSEAPSPDEALDRVLAALIAAMGWPVGVAWRRTPDGDALACQQVWVATAGVAPVFASATTSLRFRFGEGLPGMVWQERRPLWIREFQGDDRFPRARAAAVAGLHTAVGFPVLVGTDVLAVIEAFHPATLDPQDDLLAWLPLLGIQLGTYLRQAGVETALRAQAAATETELRQAVSARDAFLSIASHELKTPLTSLQLHTESLRRHPDIYHLEGQSLAKVAQIEQSVQRLNALINDLLDVSRLAVGRLALELESTDLVAVTREVMQRFEEHCARSGSTLSLSADGTIVGHWDRSRIDQVVTNLLSNAIKFGAGRPITLGIVQAGRTATLTVHDQGIGIAPEHQDRLFQRFERLVSARHFGGFGLGLWIVRQFIEAMGGTIAVESAPGQGTTFRVQLPLGAPVTGGQPTL